MTVGGHPISPTMMPTASCYSFTNESLRLPTSHSISKLQHYPSGDLLALVQTVERLGRQLLAQIHQLAPYFFPPFCVSFAYGRRYRRYGRNVSELAKAACLVRPSFVIPESVADRCIPHVTSTLYHTWKGSCAVKGRPDPVGGRNLPGKSCSTRKQSERGGLVTVHHEAFDAKGPARPDQRALRP